MTHKQTIVCVHFLQRTQEKRKPHDTQTLVHASMLVCFLSKTMILTNFNYSTAIQLNIKSLSLFTFICVTCFIILMIVQHVCTRGCLCIANLYWSQYCCQYFSRQIRSVFGTFQCFVCIWFRPNSNVSHVSPLLLVYIYCNYCRSIYSVSYILKFNFLSLSGTVFIPIWIPIAICGHRRQYGQFCLRKGAILSEERVQFWVASYECLMI